MHALNGARLMKIAAGVGAALSGAGLLKRGLATDFTGKVALVTGGSRGLGYLLARDLASQGCRIAICARDEAELDRARRDLEDRGVEVFAARCDVSDRADVETFVRRVTNHYGTIDILVNNAGIIQVGPISSMTIADFEEAMGTMFWGVLYPTLAVIPGMKQRHSGWIVNVTSIGGKISAPHLVPYGSAKFAAVGLSEGLRAELARDGISVTTIVPGLMRTGSHLNAMFKGKAEGEFTWFSLGASLPFISMDAERAAEQIIAATRRGDAERVLSVPAIVAVRFHGLFPGITSDVLGLINRILPGPTGSTDRVSRKRADAQIGSSILETLTAFGRSAARRFNE